MDLALAQNLLSPPILFFLLGAAAVRAGSDLEIPQPLPRLFSLYLLFAIGFRGGAELGHGAVGAQVAPVLATAMALAALVPVGAFLVLRRRLGAADAGALAATYGSVSAVTFITARAFLDRLGIDSSGHMVAALALMESPAIVVAVLLVRRAAPGGAGASRLGPLLHDAFLNGSVFLILGSMLVGLLSGQGGRTALQPFVEGLFPGMLSLFLLDMGMVAARRLSDLRRAGPFLLAFAVLQPLAGAAVAALAARWLGLGLGDALLLTVLAASASYIAVPAAIRVAIPEANPGLYLPLALGVTFPLNVTLGIPLYLQALRLLGVPP